MLGSTWNADLVSNARLFKVPRCKSEDEENKKYAPGGDWLTVFDLQAAKVMPGGGVEGDFRYDGKLVIELDPL